MTTLSQPQPASGIIPAGADHVDVYIKALNDFDSDEESVFLKVTTAYSTQGLAAGKPFDIGKTGDDFVLIKDAGWAVSHVEWDKNAHGNDLISKWTGRSIYADKNNPNANNDFLNVNVMVAVEGLLPTNGGTVDLICLDPLNASGTGANNYDGLLKNLPSSLTFYNNVMMRKVPVTVGINAGDNYIVKATANNGKPNNVLYSEILTVWRRLWVELDELKLSDGTATGLPLIDGFVKAELERACIETKPFSPNTTTWATGPYQLPNFWGSVHTAIVNACRNSPQPSATFWTIHMIGAFTKESGTMGTWYEDTNTIFMFDEQTRLDVEEWNNNYPDSLVSLADFKRLNSLHEIGHAFGLGDAPFAGGIMDIELDYYDSLLPVNKQLKLTEIRTIQSQPVPR